MKVIARPIGTGKTRELLETALENDGIVGIVVAAQFQQMVDGFSYIGAVRNVEHDAVHKVIDEGEYPFDAFRVAQIGEDEDVFLTFLQVLDREHHVADGTDFNETGGVAGDDISIFATLVHAGGDADRPGERQTQQFLPEYGRCPFIKEPDDRAEERQKLEQPEQRYVLDSSHLATNLRFISLRRYRR